MCWPPPRAPALSGSGVGAGPGRRRGRTRAPSRRRAPALSALPGPWLKAGGAFGWALGSGWGHAVPPQGRAQAGEGAERHPGTPWGMVLPARPLLSPRPSAEASDRPLHGPGHLQERLRTQPDRADHPQQDDPEDKAMGTERVSVTVTPRRKHVLSCGLRIHSPSARCGGDAGQKRPRSEPITAALHPPPPRPPEPGGLSAEAVVPAWQLLHPSEGAAPGEVALITMAALLHGCSVLSDGEVSFPSPEF